MNDAFGSIPTTDDETVRRIIQPISDSGKWMKLLAIMMFVSGGMAAITIIGIVFAWLPIWLGVLLWKASSSAASAATTGSESEAIDSLSQLKTMFTIQGVLTAIYLGFAALSIVLFFVLVVFANSSN